MSGDSLPVSASDGGSVGDVHRFVAGTSGGTLLVLHGTGGDENDLLPLARELAPEANLLAPRGPVIEAGMPRFFRRLAVGVFDEADLGRRTAELGRFLRAAAARYRFDPARVLALGYSNGANIAAALLLTDGSALAGAVLLRAVLPFEPQQLPDLAGKRTLLAAGRRDPYAPVERVEALADQLRRAGAAVELAWSDGGHGLEPGELDQAAIWLRRQAL
ncbi:MAG TPA: alpha/beta hydrolase [Thermoanaerobaculia bacterium]|nr:alpha/beta hydrolase [Thermoanaerobaculia bacterium]